jgi:mutator protein MutT
MIILERMIVSSSLRDLLNRKIPNKEAWNPDPGTGDFTPLAVQNGVMTEQIPGASRAPVLGVGAVIWNDRDEIVLIRRGKAPRRDQWSIPGGHLEWGETLRDAVRREVMEETGLTVEIVGLIDAVDFVTRDGSGEAARHYVLIDFAARRIAGELTAGSDAAEARWVPFSALDDYRLWSETRRVIEESRRLLGKASP